MEVTYSSVDVSNHNYKPEDYFYRKTESYYIDIVGSLPMSLLGIVGNLVSLAVWNSQSTYSATIFLFKYLAVWDTAFLVSVIPLIFLYHFNVAYNAMSALSFLSGLTRLESVHTTLLIAFTRWLAVYRPVHVHTGSLLKRRHVLVACLVVFVWCLAITAVFVTFQLVSEITDSWLHGIAVVNIVSFSVPVLPLIVFNFLTMKKIRSQFPSTSTSSSSSSSEQQLPRSRTSNQRLTIATVSMSVLTVVAYTIGETVASILWKNKKTLFITLSSVSELLQVVNSSVNVILYFTFCRKFRSSFKNCFIRRGRAVCAT